MAIAGWRGLVAVSAAVTLLAAQGCEKKDAATAPAKEPAQGTAAPKPTESSAGAIKVGHYASMTGSEATFGVSTDNGIKLAIQERNASGGVKGRQIELITYDNQGKAQESVTAVTRLIDQDKVTAVLGEVASSRSLAGGPVCQKKGVPMITPSSTNPDVTAIGDMISRVCYIDPFQGYVGAKFAFENKKYTKGATLFNRAQAYSSGLNDNFKDAFTKLGGQIVAEQVFSDGDNDFSAQLTAIKAKNPEFIYMPGYYTELVNIAKQARRLGITVPLIGGDGWDSEELRNAGDALDNCYFSNHYSHEEERPEVKAFVANYQKQFNKVPDGLAALGYDAARLLFDAIERSPSLSGKDLSAAINATKDFPGVTGMITIDAQRNANKGAVMLRIEKGIPRFEARFPAPTN